MTHVQSAACSHELVAAAVLHEVHTTVHIYITQRIDPAHTADRTQAHSSSGTFLTHATCTHGCDCISPPGTSTRGAPYRAPVWHIATPSQTYFLRAPPVPLRRATPTYRQPHSCPSCLPVCLLACTAEEHGRGLARWTSGPRTPPESVSQTTDVQQQ